MTLVGIDWPHLAASDPDDGIEMIYTEVDALLRKSLFGDVDTLLAALDATTMSSLSLIHVLAFVSITHAAREHLIARPAFMGRVRQHFTAIEPERTEGLLAGFE